MRQASSLSANVLNKASSLGTLFRLNRFGYASWRCHDTVEAPGIIRRLGIDEMEDICCRHIRADRNPIQQIRGALDYVLSAWIRRQNMKLKELLRVQA